MAGRRTADGRDDMINFVTGQPAVLAGDALVIADLHIGIEYGYYKSGIRMPSNTKGMLKVIEELIALTGAKRLVILGDVKHRVPGSSKQEMREIPDFLERLSGLVSVDIVPGNHDSDLGDFLPESVRLHPSSGFAKGGFYFMHGQAWPPSGFMHSEHVFVGHEHAQIEFRDKLGHRFYEQVWIRAELDRKKLLEKYKAVTSHLPELIIVPKFNRLSGGISMNYPVSRIDRAHKSHEGGIGPLARSSKLAKAKVYLLDGTLLGKLERLF